MNILEITKQFDSLSEDIKTLLQNSIDLAFLSTSPAFKRLSTAENRSILFEVVGSDLIIKWFKPKGQRDSDIDALIDLAGIDYFPVLYAYQKQTFLVMEKVKGIDLQQLILKKLITNDELKMVKNQYKDAVTMGIQRHRYDWDMKLEHFFWNKETKKIRMIDLGLYDEYHKPYPNIQEAVKSRLEHFDEQLMHYGLKIE